MDAVTAAIEMVDKNPGEYFNLPPALKSNRSVITKTIWCDASLFEKMEESIRREEVHQLLAVLRFPQMYNAIPDPTRKIAMFAGSKSGGLYSKFSKRYQRDYWIAAVCINSFPPVIIRLDPHLRRERTLYIMAFTLNPNLIAVDTPYMYDVDMLCLAITTRPTCYRFMSRAQRTHLQSALLAVRLCPANMEHVPRAILSSMVPDGMPDMPLMSHFDPESWDESTAFDRCVISGELIMTINARYIHDPNFVKRLIPKARRVYLNLPDEMRAVPDIAREAMRVNGADYTLLPEALRLDRTCVINAIKSYPIIYYVLPDELKRDAGVYKWAVPTLARIMNYIGWDDMNPIELATAIRPDEYVSVPHNIKLDVKYTFMTIIRSVEMIGQVPLDVLKDKNFGMALTLIKPYTIVQFTTPHPDMIDFAIYQDTIRTSWICPEWLDRETNIKLSAALGQVC